MILLTGFEPFGGLSRNPSAEVAEALDGGGVRAAVLPVDYRRIGPVLDDLLRDGWDAVLLMGVAIGRAGLSLERVAINLRDMQRPDNAGHVPASPELVEGAPAAYFSTLPLDRMRERLAREGFSAEISLSAGIYLCNAAFFLARHALEGSGTPCGFLHLPPIPDLACGADPMPLQREIEAVRLLLALLP